jgi:putative transposase
MPRVARFIVPGEPHHVTQRGNRQQEIFLRSEDWRMYKDLLTQSCRKYDVDCLAWCLMPNHVHLVLVPPEADSLRAVLASVHTAYSLRINLREKASGHLFQGRFASYPMDQAHLMAAIRYVENNPVKAGLVENAIDWKWSSARTHALRESDGLTAPSELVEQYRDWAAILKQGWESGEGEAVDQALQDGRPRGLEAWLAGVAAAGGRDVTVKSRGRPQKRGQSPF